MERGMIRILLKLRTSTVSLTDSPVYQPGIYAVWSHEMPFLS